MKNLLGIILLSIVFLTNCQNSKNNKGDLNLEKEKTDITEKYWKLTTLYGKDVTMGEHQEKEAYFRLTSAGKLEGFSGCNKISGSYTLEKGFRIRFEHVATTLKICEEGINEQGFLEVINTADNYSLSVNDETLSLNKARMAPLAVFKSIVF